MLDVEIIKKHTSSAKMEMDLASENLKRGASIEYVLSMLAEATKQINIVIDHIQEEAG